MPVTGQISWLVFSHLTGYSTTISAIVSHCYCLMLLLAIILLLFDVVVSRCCYCGCYWCDYCLWLYLFSTFPYTLFFIYPFCFLHSRLEVWESKCLQTHWNQHNDIQVSSTAKLQYFLTIVILTYNNIKMFIYLNLNKTPARR